MDTTQPLVRTAARFDPSVAWLIGVSALATVLAKLPMLAPQIDMQTYYARNVALLAAIPLALYFIAVRRPPAATAGATGVAAALAIALANALPLASDLGVLARLHLVIALWAIVALPFLGVGLRSAAARAAYVALTGEVVLLTVLLLCGGIAMSILTVFIFDTLGIRIQEWYLRNVVVWGLVTAPLVAAHLATGPRPLALVGRVATPFVPLLLATLAIYLGALAGADWRPLLQHDFLANLNAILVGVGFVNLAVICDRTRRPERRGADLLNLGLAVLTLVISAIALVAIAVRLRWGVQPVRLVIFGTDAVVLLLFAGLVWHYGRFNGGRAPLSAVTDWLGRYLPLLPVWAALVALLPLVAD
jgi:hypothetical protein